MYNVNIHILIYLLCIIVLTKALPRSGAECDEAEWQDGGDVLLEEPLGPELLRLGPELRVVVYEVVAEADEGSLLDLDVGQLPLPLPVLHALPVVPGQRAVHAEIFLTNVSSDSLSGPASLSVP